MKFILPSGRESGNVEEDMSWLLIKNSPKTGGIGLSMAQRVKANSTNVPTCGCGQGPRGWGTCGCVAVSEAGQWGARPVQWGAPTHIFPFLTPRARPGRPSRQGSASRGFAPGFNRRDLEVLALGTNYWSIDPLTGPVPFPGCMKPSPTFLPSQPWAGERGAWEAGHVPVAALLS